MSNEQYPNSRKIDRLLEAEIAAIEQKGLKIDAASERSIALRESILKRAFTGQLVPQDLSDKPVARIRPGGRSLRPCHPTR